MSIPGTTAVSAQIAPTATSDVYPTHDDTYGAGGYRVVALLADRNNIPLERRKVGMVAYVVETGETWRLEGALGNTSWRIYNPRGSAVAVVKLPDGKEVPFTLDPNVTYADEAARRLGRTVAVKSAIAYAHSTGTASPLVIIQPRMECDVAAGDYLSNGLPAGSTVQVDFADHDTCDVMYATMADVKNDGAKGLFVSIFRWVNNFGGRRHPDGVHAIHSCRYSLAVQPFHFLSNGDPVQPGVIYLPSGVLFCRQPLRGAYAVRIKGVGRILSGGLGNSILIWRAAPGNAHMATLVPQGDIYNLGLPNGVSPLLDNWAVSFLPCNFAVGGTQPNVQYDMGIEDVQIVNEEPSYVGFLGLCCHGAQGCYVNNVSVVGAGQLSMSLCMDEVGTVESYGQREGVQLMREGIRLGAATTGNKASKVYVEHVNQSKAVNPATASPWPHVSYWGLYPFHTGDIYMETTQVSSGMIRIEGVGTGGTIEKITGTLEGTVADASTVYPIIIAKATRHVRIEHFRPLFYGTIGGSAYGGPWPGGMVYDVSEGSAMGYSGGADGHLCTAGGHEKGYHQSYSGVFGSARMMFPLLCGAAFKPMIANDGGSVDQDSTLVVMGPGASALDLYLPTVGAPLGQNDVGRFGMVLNYTGHNVNIRAGGGALNAFNGAVAGPLVMPTGMLMIWWYMGGHGYWYKFV